MKNHIAAGLIKRLHDDSIDTLIVLEEIVNEAVKTEKNTFGFITFTFKDKSVIRAPDIWDLYDISM